MVTLLCSLAKFTLVMFPIPPLGFLQTLSSPTTPLPSASLPNRIGGKCFFQHSGSIDMPGKLGEHRCVLPLKRNVLIFFGYDSKDHVFAVQPSIFHKCYSASFNRSFFKWILDSNSFQPFHEWYEPPSILY